MITLLELKDRAANICSDIGLALPYEADQIETPDQAEVETWQDTADALREIASLLATGANRIAAYAANAQKRANLDD